MKTTLINFKEFIMKLIQTLLLTVAMFISSQAFALATDHPANPDTAATAYRAADYFTGQPVQVAANEHEHGDAAAPAETEGKGCKRGEGKGCCCKCCDKGEGREGEGCMRKSGAHEHGSGSEGCGMKKGMGMGADKQQEGDSSDAHEEGHH
jgi:hypothetical protein